MSYKVEPLQRNQIDWVVNVASVNMFKKEMRREEDLDLNRIREIVERVCEGGTGIVVSKGGDPIGCTGGIVVPNLFFPSRSTLVELIWYVLPEHRNGRAGYLLLKSFSELAEGLGVDEATLSVLPDTPVSDDTLLKKGFVFEEKAYRKVIRK